MALIIKISRNSVGSLSSNLFLLIRRHKEFIKLKEELNCSPDPRNNVIIYIISEKNAVFKINFYGNIYSQEGFMIKR